MAERSTLGTPLVLGEWGLAWKNTDAARFVDDVLAMADRVGAGWAYWSYDPGGADGAGGEVGDAHAIPLPSSARPRIAEARRPSKAAPPAGADETWVEVPMRFSRGTATVRVDFKPNLMVSGIGFSPQFLEEQSSLGAATS